MNSQQPIRKIKPAIIRLGLISAGSAFYYYQGHRDSGFLSGLSIMFIIIGWLVVFSPVMFADENIATKKKKSKSRRRAKRNLVIAYLALAILVIVNINFIGTLQSKRVAGILANGHTEITTGTVTEIEKRYRRFGSDSYAILTYSTPVKIERIAIPNDKNQFVVGQKFEIEYSINHPEMAKIHGRIGY